MALTDSGKAGVVVGLLVLAGALYWWLSTPPRSPFKDISYAYLPEGEVTTDVSSFIYVSGKETQAAKITLPDGRTGYPACYHPDPKVVPLQEGKVLYFPGEFLGDGVVQTPPLPPHQRPLSFEEGIQVQRYISDEAKKEILKLLGQGDAP